jgi:hypothetical protein
MPLKGSQSSALRGMMGFGDDGGLWLPLSLDEDSEAALLAALAVFFVPLMGPSFLRKPPTESFEGGLRCTKRGLSLSGSGLEESDLIKDCELPASSMSISVSSGRLAEVPPIMSATETPPGGDEWPCPGMDGDMVGSEPEGTTASKRAAESRGVGSAMAAALAAFGASSRPATASYDAVRGGLEIRRVRAAVCRRSCRQLRRERSRLQAGS